MRTRATTAYSDDKPSQTSSGNSNNKTQASYIHGSFQYHSSSSTRERCCHFSCMIPLACTALGLDQLPCTRFLACCQALQMPCFAVRMGAKWNGEFACVLYRLWRKLIRVVDFHFGLYGQSSTLSLCLSSPPCVRPLLLQLLCVCVCGLVYERTWLSDGVELRAN